ncbi:MAG: hypothetical protein OHK0017_11420 [Patescibacteria group bacterium]
MSARKVIAILQKVALYIQVVGLLGFIGLVFTSVATQTDWNSFGYMVYAGIVLVGVFTWQLMHIGVITFYLFKFRLKGSYRMAELVFLGLYLFTLFYPIIPFSLFMAAVTFVPIEAAIYTPVLWLIPGVVQNFRASRFLLVNLKN